MKLSLKQKLLFWWFVKSPIKISFYRSSYPFDKNGHWPFNVWVYKWGIAYHWRSVADARIEVSERANTAWSRRVQGWAKFARRVFAFLKGGLPA